MNVSVIDETEKESKADFEEILILSWTNIIK